MCKWGQSATELQVLEEGRGALVLAAAAVDDHVRGQLSAILQGDAAAVDCCCGPQHVLHATVSRKLKEAVVRLACTPC